MLRRVALVWADVSEERYYLHLQGDIPDDGIHLNYINLRKSNSITNMDSIILYFSFLSSYADLMRSQQRINISF
jgi:hypothetical protein